MFFSTLLNRRSLIGSAALGLVAAHPGSARAAADVTVRLPAPTGPFRIGATELHLVDRSRRDPWDPRIPVRELMVTVFYPARAVHGYPVVPQMSRGAAESFTVLGPLLHPQLPSTGVDWAATTTHSHAGAPALAGRWPVLIYSPGGGDPRTLGTGLAEDLAGHGHVVVTVDHPGDASEVEFPDRRPYRDKVRQTVFRADPRTDPATFRTMIDTRIADLQFVILALDSLAGGANPDADGRRLPDDLGRALDMRRIGLYGHSAGGTAVAEAMYENGRVGVAVNLEGYLDYVPAAPGQVGELFPIASRGTNRPLLLLGSDGFTDRAALNLSWSAMLAHGRRTVRRRLDDAAHWVFTDYAAIAPQLEAAGLMSAAGRIGIIGAISPGRSIPAVRHHVRSFFEHLR